MKSKLKSKGNGRKIEKIELIIIACFAIFGVIWVWYILPWLQYSKFYLALNPIGAYVVYNTGIITLFIAFFGIPVGYFVKGDINIIDLIRGGFASFIGFSFFIDLWSTPLAWNKNGIVAVVPTPDNMETSAVDYMAGWVFQQLGIHGSMLYLAVYVFMPIIAVIVMALILKPKELLGLFNQHKGG